MKRPGFLKRGERVRLQTFLARSGVASRRAAEEMITHGRIAVNGETVTAMGLQVVPGVDRIEVDGEEVRVAPTTWLALHKPKGYVTTRQDPFGRQTVYDLLPEKYHGLFHVGRLDRDSEGLLLLTNDGDLANRFLHPSYGITKEYDVIVTGKPSDATLRELVEGVELEDGIAKAESAKLIGPAGNGKSRLKMVLREGKKREVRRMMEAVGHEVTRLVRRRFGPVDLAELPEGKWRIVLPEELSHVREPRRAARPSRGGEEADAESPKPRGKAPARAAHNAYGDKPGKRHEKHAGTETTDAPRPRASARDEDARPRKSVAARADDARPRKSATARDEDSRPRKSAGTRGDDTRPRKSATARDEDARPRKSAAARDEDFRPRRKSAGDERPARPGTRPARAAADADAPPRKRPAAPARSHARELDDWADAPPVRTGGDQPPARGRRPGQPAAPAGDKRVPAPTRKPRPHDRAAEAFDRVEREERAAGPRGKAGPRDRAAGGSDREDRPSGPRGKTGPRDRAAGGFDREDRPAGPRGKPGSRATGGFDREDRPAGPRGRLGGDDRPARGRDRDEERGGREEREERRPARGGFGREDRGAGPRGRTPDREGRPPRSRDDEGPAPRGRFDREERGGGARGLRPTTPRERAPVDEDEDELDSWSTAPRRSSAARGGADRAGGGRPGGARGGAPGRGGAPARGGKPGGRPSGGKPSGGRPGAKGGGKPSGGKPGGARGGPGKPRRPGGGGGKPRGR